MENLNRMLRTNTPEDEQREVNTPSEAPEGTVVSFDDYKAKYILENPGMEDFAIDAYNRDRRIHQEASYEALDLETLPADVMSVAHGAVEHFWQAVDDKKNGVPGANVPSRNETLEGIIESIEKLLPPGLEARVVGQKVWSDSFKKELAKRGMSDIEFGNLRYS